MSKVLTALSRNPDPYRACAELFAQLNTNNDITSGNISCVVFFVSSMYNMDAINMGMNDSFSQVKFFGCTTAGELSANYLGTHSIVATAFPKTIIESVHIELLEDVRDNKAQMPRMVRSFENYFGTSLYNLSRTKYFGLILIDGLTHQEESILDAFGEYTNIEFTGGSVGDSMNFRQCTIFAGGTYFSSNACIVAIFKSAVPFAVECYQHFNFSGLTVEVTQTGENPRIIEKLDGKPAAVRYAELLGVPVSEANKYIVTRPFGFDINGRPLVRSIQEVDEETGAIHVFCAVLQGSTLDILEAGDLLESTKFSMRDIKRKHEKISGVIVINCALRYLETLRFKQSDEFAAQFADLPVTGFNSYGEYYIGFCNQTMTALVLEE